MIHDSWLLQRGQRKPSGRYTMAKAAVDGEVEMQTEGKPRQHGQGPPKGREDSVSVTNHVPGATSLKLASILTSIFQFQLQILNP